MQEALVAAKETTMKFTWREGSRVKNLKASDAAARINSIRRKLKRDVRPADLLEDARNPHSPLHPAFEWDDSVAAEKWRLSQAQSILVSIEVVEKDADGNDSFDPVRAFVRVQHQDEKPAYMPIIEAMQNDAMRAQVLAMAKNEAMMWARRYRRYQEFSKIVAAIEEVAR